MLFQMFEGFDWTKGFVIEFWNWPNYQNIIQLFIFIIVLLHILITNLYVNNN